MRKQSFNEKYYIYNVNNIQKNIYRNKNMHKKVRKLKMNIPAPESHLVR